MISEFLCFTYSVLTKLVVNFSWNSQNNDWNIKKMIIYYLLSTKLLNQLFMYWNLFICKVFRTKLCFLELKKKDKEGTDSVCIWQIGFYEIFLGINQIVILFSLILKKNIFLTVLEFYINKKFFANILVKFLFLCIIYILLHMFWKLFE